MGRYLAAPMLCLVINGHVFWMLRADSIRMGGSSDVVRLVLEPPKALVLGTYINLREGRASPTLLPFRKPPSLVKSYLIGF